MAKETRRSRKIPILNVFPINENTRQTILEDDKVKHFVVAEAFRSIQDAYTTKKKVATLFSLNGKEVFYGIEKKDWTQALNSCIDYHIKADNFEMCMEISALLDKLNIKKVNDKVARSNKRGS